MDVHVAEGSHGEVITGLAGCWDGNALRLASLIT